MRHVSQNSAPIKQATLIQLRELIGDLIEAVSQLDMARESGGVVSDDVMSRLRRVLAEPAHDSQEVPF